MHVHVGTIGCTVEAAPGDQLSDCTPEEIVGLLRQHGWVYFTGFKPSIAEFHAYAARFGRCATPRVIHYPPGGVALGFHAEDSFNPWRPDALWFLCLAAGSDGGTPTGVVDGVQLLQDLEEKWRTFCLDNTLRFDRAWAQDRWQQAVGGDRREEVSKFLDRLPGLTYEFLPDGTLCTTFRTRIVVRTRAGAPSLSNTMLHAITDPGFYGMSLADGSPVPEELIAHIEKLALENELPVGWSDGDLAILDNHRLMHRRGEYQGTDRDLRVIHGEEFYGSVMPVTTSPLEMALKEALQGEEDLR